MVAFCASLEILLLPGIDVQRLLLDGTNVLSEHGDLNAGMMSGSEVSLERSEIDRHIQSKLRLELSDG